MKMTCQVCGRKIEAKKGVIAHHGYTRPYEGWQTKSCDGARYVPYEVSCERLKQVTENITEWIAVQETTLAGFLATPPESITVVERKSGWDKQGKEVVYTKPENFDAQSYRASMFRTYENAYKSQKLKQESLIRNVHADLVEMNKRITEWVLVEAE